MNTRSLAGRRVLLTRAAEDSQRWALRLAERGVSPEILPCVRSERIDDDATLDRLRDTAHAADWLLFTSVRGVDAIARAIARAGVLLPARLRVAAVGEATAAAARAQLGCVPYVPLGGTSLALGTELLALWGGNSRARRVLVAGAEGGRDDAEQVLEHAGARVTRVNVYRTLPTNPATPRRDLAQEGIDDVLLASPSAVAGLLNQARVGGTTRLFTIGPTTSAAAISAGLAVTGESVTPDLDGLMEVMQCPTGT